MIKQRKDAGIYREKRKGKGDTRKITIQLEVINQKVSAKEGKLKGYR